MASGLIGKKLGMTQVFTHDGRCVPVTVVKVGPCVVLQKKTKERDGYNAIQIGFDEKPNRKPYTNRAMNGHFKKAGKGAFRRVSELRIDDIDSYEIGQELNANVFQLGQLVSITGTSKGRGFQGVLKRHGFGGGKQTHGSMSHRRPGSIGQCAYPSRVFKGHRMEGHMGDKKVTVRNLEIVEVDAQNHLLLIKGAVPGANNNFVLVRAK